MGCGGGYDAIVGAGGLVEGSVDRKVDGCGDATSEAGREAADGGAAGCGDAAGDVAVALSFLTAELIGDSVKICTPDIAIEMDCLLYSRGCLDK